MPLLKQERPTNKVIKKNTSLTGVFVMSNKIRKFVFLIHEVASALCFVAVERKSKHFI